VEAPAEDAQWLRKTGKLKVTEFALSIKAKF